MAIMVSLINANTLKIPLADKSVHMACCSPPYWGLRNYGLDDAGIGLEPTPEEYIANMVAVGREIWRVLRDDGTLWLNLGDAYAHSSSGGGGAVDIRKDGRKTTPGDQVRGRMAGVNTISSGLKPKDLCGIPWRVALALQADGWYLRSDCIWAKPNPMPESVTDRPTKAHEYVFLLTKRAKYFYDADAVREEGNQRLHAPGWSSFDSGLMRNDRTNGNEANAREWGQMGSRNRRTVWTIATQPYSGAHFATFPEALVEPMIKAGTSERGCCPECGAQWERVTEKTPSNWEARKLDGAPMRAGFNNRNAHGSTLSHDLGWRGIITTSFRPTCTHNHDPQPCTVLDPFAGSGTTGVVARRLGRHFIGLDLSFDYLHDQARSRLELDRLDGWGKANSVHDDMSDLPLFKGIINDAD